MSPKRTVKRNLLTVKLRKNDNHIYLKRQVRIKCVLVHTYTCWLAGGSGFGGSDLICISTQEAIGTKGRMRGFRESRRYKVRLEGQAQNDSFPFNVCRSRHGFVEGNSEWERASCLDWKDRISYGPRERTEKVRAATIVGRTPTSKRLRNFHWKNSQRHLRRWTGSCFWKGWTHLWVSAHDGLQWFQQRICILYVYQSNGCKKSHQRVE